MNKPQINKVTSCQTLRLVLDDAGNQPIWKALPAFAKGVTQFYGSMNVLSALSAAQGEVTTGIAADKKRLAESVINRTAATGPAPYDETLTLCPRETHGSP